MRQFRCTKNHYHDLIIVFIVVSLVLMKNFVDCARNFVSPSETSFYRADNVYVPICDDIYRANYFYRDIERDRYVDRLPREQGRILRIEKSEFLTHNEEHSSEFIEHERSANRRNSLVSDVGMIIRNCSDAIESRDLENSPGTVRRIFWDDEKRQLGWIKNHENRMTIGKHLKRKKLSKSIESRGRLDNEKFPPYYTMRDTFGGIFKTRRDNDDDDESDESDDESDESRRNDDETEIDGLRRDGWGSDSCKSMRRIVGGWMPQSPEQFPYLVFVDTGCGGAIIGDVWVLTAGHCVYEDDPKYVHAGSLELLGGCQYNVAKIYIHPKFERKRLQYDLGLLRVNPSFVYSPAIKPIMLSKHRVRYRMCGVVAGWGAEAYQGPPTMHVKMTLLPVVSRKKCYMFGIHRGQFCAGYENGRTDTCQGDSGGPFVVNDYVAGIVSYGYECATPYTPAVYVDVSQHRQWIQSICGIK